MKKYKVSITIEKEIEVCLDEKAFSDPEFAKFHKEQMYGFTTLREHAEHIAQFYARFEGTYGMDGYCGMDKNFKVKGLSEDIECDVEEVES